MYNVVTKEGLVEDARAILAGLIRQLESPATPPAVRLQAAIMANRLARAQGDLDLADMAESLASKVDVNMPAEIIAGLHIETSVARATRRTIALAAQHQLRSPKDLAMALVADPVALAQQVRDQLAHRDIQGAHMSLATARQRHPHNDQQARLDATVGTSDDKPQPVG